MRDANELHAQKQREWVADNDVPLRGEFFGSVANPDRKTLYSKDVLNAQIEKAQRFLSQPEASTAQVDPIAPIRLFPVEAVSFPQTSLLEKKMQEWAADQQYCRVCPSASSSSRAWPSVCSAPTAGSPLLESALRPSPRPPTADPCVANADRAV